MNVSNRSLDNPRVRLTWFGVRVGEAFEDTRQYGRHTSMMEEFLDTTWPKSLRLL